MSFVSFAFLFLFAAALAARLTIGRQKTEPAYAGALIVASVVFYSWHVAIYLTLLFGSTLIDFLAARGIASEPAGSARRRTLLIVSLVANLGVLCVFKYSDFLLAPIFALFADGSAAPSLGLALPLGISFYTFQSMSYTIEVYRGSQRPVSGFWQLFLFVSFFPQLVAGPIVRAQAFLYQIARRRRVNPIVMSEAAYLIIRGFFLKMVCANNFAPAVDAIFADALYETNSTRLAIGAVLFGGQIFCDFAGYSSIARGVGYALGFQLPVNFDNPYLAATFSDFWRRWHITLSQWLRDFLYIPLGGNRISGRRTYLNLMLVMLLGGLWHGAAWTFVLWGVLHGAALAIERLLGLHRIDQRPHNPAYRLLWYLCVQVVVFVGWIVFRCETLTGAETYLGNLFAFGFRPVSGEDLVPLAFAAPVVVMHLRGLAADRSSRWRVRPTEKAVAAAIMLIATLTLYGQDTAFIYFQF